MKESTALSPRVLRYKDAYRYLGMDRSVFDVEVRPYVPEAPIGKQGIGFDRLDLDAWWEQHKASRGRPAKPQEKTPWQKKQCRASGSEAGRITSKRGSSPSPAGDFEKALARLTSEKHSAT